MARLYEAAAPAFRAGVLLGAALGLRQSEASAVTVDRVDFLRREVRIDRQFSHFGWGQSVVVATPSPCQDRAGLTSGV